MAIRLLLYCVLYTIAWWSSPTAGHGAVRDSLFRGRGNRNNSVAKGPPPELPLQFHQYSPQNVYVHAGKPAVLNCSGYDSHPDYGPVNVTWLHDGFPFKSDDHLYVSAEGQLHITTVYDGRETSSEEERRYSDEGEYQCVISNKGGALRARPIKLHIARLHLEKRPIIYYDFIEGSVGSLNCVVDSSPSPTITWLKDDSPLPEDPRYIQLPTGFLYVSTVQFSDAGRYKCRVHNTVLRTTKTSEEVLVQVENRHVKVEMPWFIIPDDEEEPVRTTIKGDAILRCLAQGNPPPKVFWTKDHHNLSSTLEIGNYAEIHIRNAKQSDEGTYRCNAVSPEGNSIMDTTLQVMVPPDFDSVPKSQHIFASAIVRINCSAKGSPSPGTTWIKNGREIELTTGIHIGQRDNQLRISSTSSKDAGIYQCIASNDAGWASHAAFIKIKSNINMSVPKNVRVFNIKTTSAEVSWTIYNTGTFAYTVHYHVKDSSAEPHMLVTNETRATVTKLKPYTAYRLSVRYYRIGTNEASDPSESYDFITDEDVPIAQLVPKFKVTSPSSMLVTWIPLNDSQAVGKVTRYKFQWKVKGQGITTTKVLPGNTTHFLVTDTTPGEIYIVRVIAGTKKGFAKQEGTLWNWWRFKMPEENSSTPMELTLTPVGATAILASWKLKSSSRITANNINLEYGKNKRDMIEVILDSSSVSYLIDDLDANTTYKVSVYAVFGNLDGENSNGEVKTFLRDEGWPLAAPQDLTGSNVSATTVGLSWIAVEPVDHYSIQYHVEEQPKKRNVVFSNSSSVTIKGLSPNTSYKFNVRCHMKQPSPGKHAQLKIRTKREVPGAVRDLQSAKLNTTTVLLAWRAPNIENGPLESYVVNYTSNPNQGPWKQTEVIPPPLEATISGLEVGKEYYITVAAKNSAGVGPSAKTSLYTFGFSNRTVPEVPSNNTTSKNNDSKRNEDSLFYIVLAVVAVVVLLVAAAIFICCRKIQSKERPRKKTTSNGYPHNCREMQTMLPVSADLDTKGGSSPKRANGLSHPVTLDCQLHYKELNSRNDTPLLLTTDHVATESGLRRSEPE